MPVIRIPCLRERLPKLTEQDYAKLVMESAAHPGVHEPGGEDETGHAKIV
jgi:hypothetical protein